MICNLLPGALELPRDYTRSKGVHLSNILRCCATDMGILTQEQVEELSLVDMRHILDPVGLLRISMGLAWEEWYLNKVLTSDGVTKHPGEMCADGIYMTPDGESLETKCNALHLVIHEVKYTYKSTNTVGESAEDLKKQWLWMAQLMGYCRAAKTQYAKLHVLFCCANYRFPIRPELKVWDIEFSKKELDSNWALVLESKKYYGDER